MSVRSCCGLRSYRPPGRAIGFGSQQPNSDCRRARLPALKPTPSLWVPIAAFLADCHRLDRRASGSSLCRSESLSRAVWTQQQVERRPPDLAPRNRTVRVGHDKMAALGIPKAPRAERSERFSGVAAEFVRLRARPGKVGTSFPSGPPGCPGSGGAQPETGRRKRRWNDVRTAGQNHPQKVRIGS